MARITKEFNDAKLYPSFNTSTATVANIVSGECLSNMLAKISKWFSTYESKWSTDYLPLSGGTMNGSVSIRFQPADGNRYTLFNHTGVSYYASNTGATAVGAKFINPDRSTQYGFIGGYSTLTDGFQKLLIGGNYNDSWIEFTPTNISIPLTTASTSQSSGALTISGGVGISGSIHSGDITVHTADTSQMNVQKLISFTNNDNTFVPIQIRNGDNSGIALGIGAGGLTCIGGGESVQNWLNLPTSGTGDVREVTNSGEAMAILSDGNIYIFTGCNTIADRKRINITSSPYVYPQVTAGSALGTTSYPWNSIQANTLICGKGGTRTGIVRFYHQSQSTYYYHLTPSAAPTANTTIYLPKSGGTLALESTVALMSEITPNGSISTTIYIPGLFNIKSALIQFIGCQSSNNDYMNISQVLPLEYIKSLGVNGEFYICKGYDPNNTQYMDGLFIASYVDDNHLKISTPSTASNVSFGTIRLYSI